MGDTEQDADDDVVGNNRATAVAQEGQRETGQGKNFHIACGNDDGLNGENRGKTRGQQLTEGVGCLHGDTKAAVDEQQIDAYDSEDAGEAELFTKGSEDHIGLDNRDKGGVAQANTCSNDASVC